MPEMIIKVYDYYLEYSTISDAPLTFGMKLDEFKEYYQCEYGRNGMDGLQRRLDRLEERAGTTSVLNTSMAETIRNNRAGPNEENLTIDEIYRAYCLREPIRDGWTVPEAEEG